MGAQSCAMHFVANPSDSEIAPPIRHDTLATTSAQLSVLLGRCAELSKDLAQIYGALRRLTQHHNPSRVGRKIAPSDSRDDLRRAMTGNGLRHPLMDDRRARSGRSTLERACRIALMETNEPSSAEAIYDRIQRRGSFTFSGYKRPLRAIILVMNGMARRGEAIPLNEGGNRRWRWQTRQTAFEPMNPPTLT
jgi:hypothetical protein